VPPSGLCPRCYPTGLRRSPKNCQAFGLFWRLKICFDYCPDTAIATSDALPKGTTPVRTSGAPYQLPLSVDDLLGVGIHARVIAQLAPSAELRQAYVGWQYQTKPGDDDAIGFAAVRAGTVNRAGKLGPTAEVSAGFLNVGGVGCVAFSCAYNASDSVGLFPVQNAHGVGLHMGKGVPLPAMQTMPAGQAPRRASGRQPGYSRQDQARELFQDRGGVDRYRSAGRGGLCF